MLLQFSVRNFASFRNLTVLSLLAGADKEHSEILLPVRREKLLPSCVVYGANAAGKSNIFRAMGAAVDIVRTSNKMQSLDKITQVEPFAAAGDGASDFDFIFTVGDVKYRYGFSADYGHVTAEYLYVYKTQRPAVIFERDETGFKFNADRERKYRAFADMTPPNKLLLATLDAWNQTEVRPAFLWFLEGIGVYGSGDLKAAGKDLLGLEQDCLRFAVDLLSIADININSVNVEENNGSFEITTEHLVRGRGGDTKFNLPIEKESEGTKRLLYLSPFIRKSLACGQTLVIDEIDASLHPNLVCYLISLYHNPEINSRGAQLVVNTQDVTLLDLKYMRRDQIYFVEKDRKTGVSELYALDEFSPRKDENIRKGYLNGRYGAVPVISVKEPDL